MGNRNNRKAIRLTQVGGGSGFVCISHIGKGMIQGFIFPAVTEDMLINEIKFGEY